MKFSNKFEANIMRAPKFGVRILVEKELGSSTL